tara:strand:- start:488 stop:2008 length:1521 start_codon:yes stop_codon:yes gene_type:complete
MAINMLFPFLAGALKARSDIKAINEDEYDTLTGDFIDAASSEYLRSQTAEKKRIDKNKKAYEFIAADSRFGTATAEYFAKTGVYDVFETPKEILSYAETKLQTDPNLFTQLKNFNKDNPETFKNVFAENQQIAQSKLENKAAFASQNLNKGATKFLSDTFLEPGQSKFSKVMFGPKVDDRGAFKATTALTEGFDTAEEDAEKVIPSLETDRKTRIEAAAIERQKKEGTATIDDTVVQKFEYTPIQSIGNSRDVSNSVAAVLGYNATSSNIGADGVILFPAAFATDSEAIKEQMQISANSGAYKNVDGTVNTTALAQDANRIIEQNIKQPIQAIFNVDYARSMTAEGKKFNPSDKTVIAGAKVLDTPITIDGEEYNFTFDKKMFTEIFGKHVEKPITDNDLVIRSTRPAVVLSDRFKRPQRGGTKAREAATKEQKAGSKDAGYLITENAFKAIQNYINNETVNTFERKLFIESLPDNYSYNVTLQNGQVMSRNLKSDLLQLFGYPKA